jgi:hypothetical protein
VALGSVGENGGGNRIMAAAAEKASQRRNRKRNKENTWRKWQSVMKAAAAHESENGK